MKNKEIIIIFSLLSLLCYQPAQCLSMQPLKNLHKKYWTDLTPRQKRNTLLITLATAFYAGFLGYAITTIIKSNDQSNYDYAANRPKNGEKYVQVPQTVVQLFDANTDDTNTRVKDYFTYRDYTGKKYPHLDIYVVHNNRIGNVTPFTFAVTKGNYPLARWLAERSHLYLDKPKSKILYKFIKLAIKNNANFTADKTLKNYVDYFRIDNPKNAYIFLNSIVTHKKRKIKKLKSSLQSTTRYGSSQLNN